MRLVIVSAIFLVTIQSTTAYIDPGTGGTIISSLWPVIIALFAAVGAFFARIFWHPIKSIFKKGKK
ncbi:MAG: hypothetical protein KKG59_05585 [Nanoarchaeota archaeon]|nr:hypothetical protein [Nanoarchaeota archaeon]